ncbi:MAG: hypothetical protein WC586_00515 [Methanoregula sp.]
MVLSPTEAAVMVIDAAGGRIAGRTAIQKIIYFGTVRNAVKATYRPHYYGPYSADISGALQTITSCHFVDEAMDTDDSRKVNETFEWKRYSYTLNDEGRKVTEFLKAGSPKDYEEIKKIVDICKKTAKLDPNVLSWAAKVHYIIKQEHRQMTYEEVSKIAKSLNWQLQDPQIATGVNLLKELSLVTG